MRKLTMILSLAFISVMLSAMVVMADENKAENETDVEKVFPKDEVQKLIAEIEKKEVLPDKETGSMSPAKASGSYPKRKGVILATADAYKGLIPTGHAAIVYDPQHVIEAVGKGVVKGGNRWYRTKKTCWGVTVKKISAKKDAAAAEWCKRQLGKPYNYNYFNIKTRAKFYCSHLVWASFRDKYRIDLNTSAFGIAIHPLELVSTSKTRTVYKK